MLLAEKFDLCSKDNSSYLWIWNRLMNVDNYLKLS